MSTLFGVRWRDAILGASTQHEAIHYAVLAVGAVHKETTTSGNREDNSYAIKQYNRSIRRLVHEKSVGVVLSGCVLYICLEVR